MLLRTSGTPGGSGIEERAEDRLRSRWATMHTTVTPLRAGTRSISVRTLSGKSHRLRPDRYRAIVRARDAAGNRSGELVRELRVRR